MVGHRGLLSLCTVEESQAPSAGRLFDKRYGAHISSHKSRQFADAQGKTNRRSRARSAATQLAVDFGFCVSPSACLRLRADVVGDP